MSCEGGKAPENGNPEALVLLYDTSAFRLPIKYARMEKFPW